jgi:hypothetical protein
MAQPALVIGGLFYALSLSPTGCSHESKAMIRLYWA